MLQGLDWLSITHLVSVAASFATAVMISLQYIESRRSRERFSVAEALHRVALPLMQRIESLIAYQDPAVVDWREVSVDRYVESARVGGKAVKEYFDKLLGLIGRYRFYRMLEELNRLQKELRHVAEELLKTLRDLLTNDPHIQDVYRSAVSKSDYPTLEQFVERLTEDFYRCYHKYTSVWGGYINVSLCNVYAEKVKEHLNKYEELLNERKKIGEKLKSILEDAVTKAMKRYGIPYSELEHTLKEIESSSHILRKVR